MADWNQIGRTLLLVGLGLALMGGLLILGTRFLDRERFPWLGRLPGDIRIERKGFSCYFPLATSILVSLILTLLLNLIVRLLRRQ
jgi:hypothetical protein